MKRKLFVAALCLLALLALVAASGPLLVQLGVQPICIQQASGRIRVVRCAVEPTRPPALQASTALPLAADAQPIIIDTDMAADDWMAILYLLQRSDVDVKAITVAGTGEAHCGPGVQNALNLVALAGRPEMPIACGRETPLKGNHTFPTSWRQSVDNLLGLSLPKNGQNPSGTSAVELLTRMILGSSRRVQLIALGPLTNVAEALEAQPSLAGKVTVTIMGGAVHVPGNVGPSSNIDNAVAEWNIYVDPHAATLVFSSGAAITLVPLDATNHAPVTMNFFRGLERDRTTPAAEFIYRVLTQKESDIRSGGYYFWDPLAAAIATQESLGTFQELSVTVIEKEGPESGRTQVSDSGYKIRVTVAADRAHFETLFLDGLNGRLR